MADRVTLIAQELGATAVDLPDAEANQYLAWNDAGTALVNVDGANFALTIGTVTTGSPGSSASATISGTATDAILNLTIPAGATGASGAGTGDMVAANNLSDVASKKTARDTIAIHGADVASAGTINLDAATGYLVDVTGTTGITAITLTEGRERWVRFTGALPLTHGASLVLPNSDNITTAAGDYAHFVGYAAGVVRCTTYNRASHATRFADIKQAATSAATGVVELATVAEAATGTDTSRAVTPAGLFPAEADVASATTTDLGAATTTYVKITGTTTITGFGTVAAGIVRHGRFESILTLTYNATSLILPGAASITTAANDRFSALSLGSGNWIVTQYTRADGTALVSSTSSAASQAQMEAASSNAVMVTPGRQQYHPASCKAWVKFGTTGAVSASYNITSVSDGGTGIWTVNIDTNFSSTDYCGVASVGREATPHGLTCNVEMIDAGQFRIYAYDISTGGLADPGTTDIYAVFFGDQA
jgi:hypothetical protein